MVNCQFPRLLCNNFPITPGRPSGQPTGIVLHFLPEDLAGLAATQSSANKKLWRNAQPRGYHFLIENDGTSLYLNFTQDTVPNLYLMQGPSAAAIALVGYPGVNPDPFVIHIGLTSVQNPCAPLTPNQYLELVRVVCCLAAQYPMIPIDPEHVLTACDFRSQYCDGCNDDVPPVVPATLYGDVANCLAGGSPVNLPGGPTFTVPPCCTENAEDIVTLQAQVALLITGQATLTTLVNTFDARITALEIFRTAVEQPINDAVGQYEAIALDQQNLHTYLASIQGCLECLCPADLNRGRIEYILQAESDKLFVTPFINRIVNFPTKVYDFVPEVVQAGPLWTVDLPGGNYSLDITIRFSPAEYCTGCNVWLDIVQCGVRTRLLTQTQSGGLAVVTLAYVGSIAITTPCPDLHFEVGTDNTLGMPAGITVEYGDVKITTV